MRIKITGGGIYDGAGNEIPIGSEFNIADPEVGADGEPLAPHPWAGRFETISDSQKGKTGVTNDEPPPLPAEFVPPVGPFTAKESSPGWWAIFDGKDQPVGKKARKADLDGFDGLSDDDKAEFATDHAKKAWEAEQKA